MNFFRYDSPFSQFMMWLLDFLFVGFLWILSSLPLVTVGAATAGLYCAMQNALWHDRRQVWRHFWLGFFREFGHVTLLWLLQVLMAFVLWTDWRITVEIASAADRVDSWMLIVLAVVAVLFVLWSQYWFAYQTHYQDKLRTVLKNTFLMALCNPLLTLGHAALVAVFLLLGYLFFNSVLPLVILLPGLFAALSCWLLNGLFKKYEGDSQ